MNVPLNQPYLPDFDKYNAYLKTMYKNKWLTNNGPILQEFSQRLADYLGVPFIVPTSSGTAALQLAYKLFNLKGSIVTTPFSFVATCNSAEWLGLDVNFADIDPCSLNISSNMIEKAIDKDTSAIVPVHTYGNPCNVNEIASIAKKHHLKVIYDAAHAFGVKRFSKSILLEGDASALSLHATKLFHCLEGGALILKNAHDYEKAMAIINFGINSEKQTINAPGFNGKMSEAHAAMGLAMLDDIEHVISVRLGHYHLYKKLLGDAVDYPAWDENANQCAAYFPILLENESVRYQAIQALKKENIESRAYFSPSLNQVEHYAKIKRIVCPVSELMTKKVLCLPLYYSLSEKQIQKVCRVLKRTISNTEKLNNQQITLLAS